MSSNIKTPKLCKSSARWYVYFSVNGKQKRYTGSLNRIKNIKETNLLLKRIETLEQINKGQEARLSIIEQRLIKIKT